MNTPTHVRILWGMSRQKMRPEFNRLHAATLDRATTTDQLRVLLDAADAFPERRRLSEGAVYVSAQRRWTLLTGTDWKGSHQQPADSAWGGQSSHRFRSSVGELGEWDCSCGYGGSARCPSEAERAHARHVREATSVHT